MDWSAYTSLTDVDVTYQSYLTLSSANYPDADEGGNIFVSPGKKIPGISPLQLNMDDDYNVTLVWPLETDVLANSDQYYLGGDSNQNAKPTGYAVFNFHSSYQVTRSIKYSPS